MFVTLHPVVPGFFATKSPRSWPIELADPLATGRVRPAGGLLGQPQQPCLHGIGNRIVGRNRYQTRRQFRRWLVSSVQFFEVLKASVGNLARALVSRLEPALDFAKIDIELDELKTNMNLLAFSAQKFTVHSV